MDFKTEMIKAKEYLSKNGYGTGSNFSINTVANLMVEFAGKKEEASNDSEDVCVNCDSNKTVYNLCGECLAKIIAENKQT